MSFDFEEPPRTTVDVRGGSAVDSAWLVDFGVSIVGTRLINNSTAEDTGNWARLFDSSSPTGGDRDLGSPNKNCPGCANAIECPGFSRQNGNGFLLANVTNCVAQNNVLIIHEGLASGDDNGDGGYIDFTFANPIEKFLDLSVMDVEDGFINNEISFFGASGSLLTDITVLGLGDNVVQDLNLQYSSSADLIKTSGSPLLLSKSTSTVRKC